MVRLIRVSILTSVLFSFSNVWAQNAEIRIALFPAGSFIAKTTKVVGQAEISGSEVSAKDIKIETGTFDSGVSLRNKHMRDRFESSKFPFAVLNEATGKDGKGKGKLTIKDITKEIEGTYKIVDDKFLEATFKTKASDFQIKDVAYMGVGMEDELEVFVSVPLVKKSAAAPATPAKAETTPAKKESKAKKGKKGK